MKTIKTKLASKRGASLVIAIVFMMFCAFIGGSVLAAATANAGQLRTIVQNQQTYLDQRSALQLILHELGNPSDLKLKVSLEEEKTTDCHYKNGGILVMDGEPVTRKSVVIKLQNPQVSEQITSVQKCFYECFAKAYIRHAFDPSDPNNLWLETDTVTNDITHSPILLPYAGEPSAYLTLVVNDQPIRVKMSCEFHSEKMQGTDYEQEYFSFTVSFGDEENPAPQLLKAYAKVFPIEKGRSNPKIDYVGSSSAMQKIETSTRDTFFSWNLPKIEKGGDAE